MYTSTDVQTAVIEQLRDTPLSDAINGSVRRQGTRTRDSNDEDAVVSVTSLTADQRQSGFVRVTIYVPDFMEGASAVRRANLKRCAELERLLTNWATSLRASGTGDILFRLAEGVSTTPSPERAESLVSARLYFKIAE